MHIEKCNVSENTLGIFEGVQAGTLQKLRARNVIHAAKSILAYSDHHG